MTSVGVRSDLSPAILLPLAATLATGEIFGAFLGDYAQSKSFFHGHTYGGNPLGAAVALATLEVFEEVQRVNVTGTWLTCRAVIGRSTEPMRLAQRRKQRETLQILAAAMVLAVAIVVPC